MPAGSKWNWYPWSDRCICRWCIFTGFHSGIGYHAIYLCFNLHAIDDHPLSSFPETAERRRQWKKKNQTVYPLSYCSCSSFTGKRLCGLPEQSRLYRSALFLLIRHIFWLSTTIILTAGTLFVMWLGEKITDKGLGNGSSVIIMVGILARLTTIILAGLAGSRISNRWWWFIIVRY